MFPVLGYPGLAEGPAGNPPTSLRLAGRAVLAINCPETGTKCPCG